MLLDLRYYLEFLNELRKYVKVTKSIPLNIPYILEVINSDIVRKELPSNFIKRIIEGFSRESNRRILSSPALVICESIDFAQKLNSLTTLLLGLPPVLVFVFKNKLDEPPLFSTFLIVSSLPDVWFLQGILEKRELTLIFTDEDVTKRLKSIVENINNEELVSILTKKDAVWYYARCTIPNNVIPSLSSFVTEILCREELFLIGGKLKEIMYRELEESSYVV